MRSDPRLIEYHICNLQDDISVWRGKLSTFLDNFFWMKWSARLGMVPSLCRIQDRAEPISGRFWKQLWNFEQLIFITMLINAFGFIINQTLLNPLLRPDETKFCRIFDPCTPLPHSDRPHRSSTSQTTCRHNLLEGF
jgi:hypothetical protein